jgi:hypothetical protein
MRQDQAIQIYQSAVDATISARCSVWAKAIQPLVPAE